LESLLMRGFVSLPRDGGEPEIISSDGEVIATMKNGTEYVLRFGDLKRVTAAQQEADKADAAEGDAPSGKEGIHRYLFVMARFNESAVKQPELEVPPDLPAAGGGEVPRDAGAATDDGEAATNESASAEVGVPPVAPQVEGQSTPDQPATSQSADAAKTGAGEVAQPTGQSGTDEAAQKTEPAGGTSDLDKAVAERKRIEADNQRKLSEYEETLKKGRENVKQLNDRFSDWYFVVADDVFSKIRLGRDAVVKKKDPKDAAGKSAPTGGPSSTERNDGAASEYGAPGTSIPGLPEIPKTDRE
jgi:hypothetical protein